MEIKDITFYLKNYVDLKQCALNNEKFITLKGYRRKNKIVIDSNIKKIIEIIQKLENSLTDTEVSKLFNLCFLKKLKDREALGNIHMSPSTFYRIKDQILNKFCLILTANGLISEEEILKLTIK